jgi:hypothetical protein
MNNLHIVLPPASETSMISEEPTWQGEVVKYNTELLRGLNWHNYCASEKDVMKYMEQWIREYRPTSAKNDIAASPVFIVFNMLLTDLSTNKAF